jgi:hypothetical protein
MKEQCVVCEAGTEILTRSERFYLRYVQHLYHIARQAEGLSVTFSIEEVPQKQ